MNKTLYFISMLFVAVVAFGGFFNTPITAQADFGWLYPDGSYYPTDYTSCGYSCSTYDWTYDYGYDDYYYYPTYDDYYYYPTTYDYGYNYGYNYSYYPSTYTYVYTPPPTYNPPTYTPPPAVPNCSIYTTSYSTQAGSPVTLSWYTSNAQTAFIDNGIGGVATSGTRTVTPSFTTTYTMTVAGQGGTANCQTTVVVQQVQTPSCVLSITSQINQGNSATLSWSTNNASSISIDQGIGSVSTGSGSRTVNPSNSTTYTATVYGQNGQTATCQASIAVTQAQQPWCTLSVSSSSVGQGQGTVLQWNTSSNASSFFINPSVGTVNTGVGSRVVYPNTTTTYVGTVYGQNGQSATCQATVGAYAASNVSLFQQPGNQPLASVSLTQVPYTGFEAGPVVTFIFWLAVVLWSFGIAYIVMGAKGLQFIAERAFGYTPASVGVSHAYSSAPAAPSTQYGTREDEYVNGFDAAHTASAVVAPTQNLRDIIEMRANAAGVLLSPEAAKMSLALGETSEETLARFADVLEKAGRTLPREDGWILLSSDRFQSLVESAPEISASDLSV